MRLTLNDNEIQKLLECIKSDKTQEPLFNKILYQIEKKKNSDISLKQNAVSIARSTKSEITKNKIKDAINYLNSNRKKTTIYAICKTSGVCFRSVKKYLAETQN